MAYGTAPRKVNGIWVTRTGRRLTTAGQAYWNHLHTQGITDGSGHIDHKQAQIVASATVGSKQKAKQPVAPTKAPPPETFIRAGIGDAKAKRQVQLYKQSKQATASAKRDVTAATDARFAGVIPAAKKANK